MTGSFPAFIQSFLDYLKYEKRYSVHTLSSYRTDLADFFTYLDTQFGRPELKEITHGYIRSWLAFLKEKKLSTVSINHKISTLRSFFKFQVRTGALSQTPMANVISPKGGKKLPVFVKENDMAALAEALNHSTEDWKSLNARLLITVFYATGMRLSELIGLKEKQVDFSKNQLKVWGKGNKERIIPLGKNITLMFKEYMAAKKRDFGPGPDSLLVTHRGRKMYPKYAYLLVKEFLSQVNTLDKRSPHVLRHSFATHLMNNGANLNAVKELLGHSSLAATQVYTHNTIEKLKNVHQKSHPKA
jgi:integrase/recombinase XerC